MHTEILLISTSEASGKKVVTLSMNRRANIIIAGAGGIAEAAGLLLMEWSVVTPKLYIGNRTLSKAKKMAAWIEDGANRPCSIQTFHLPEEGFSEEMKEVLEECDILLDCLPGGQAPRMAKLARDFKLHYANLTEYVTETNEIIDLAKDAGTGFILQTGLAPGYIDVLANGMFQEFCRAFEVDEVDKLELKVGALTANAVAPHYYGFTWSPVGVATEYLEGALALRDFKITKLPALSERERIIIDGTTYEEDLTSGGAADLPEALVGRVRHLDYKTLRYPGHYTWVEEQLGKLPGNKNVISALQSVMEKQIPHLEDDRIILYAAVEGRDALGTLHRREIFKKITPQTVGKHSLRAIQTTTAAPLLQAAQLLLESNLKGVVLQSQIDPFKFLNGHFIQAVYGGHEDLLNFLKL
ncbi:saccharopine dehydrogenase family protein [Salinimicrobium gaetbulicola]|uniref:Saccharopine dehydrogenase family protein n=1 Tax=Salinimicrobium gaetbulicola TaxID=999702 RepID=A0ABW3IEK2_9FLAO